MTRYFSYLLFSCACLCSYAGLHGGESTNYTHKTLTQEQVNLITSEVAFCRYLVWQAIEELSSKEEALLNLERVLEIIEDQLNGEF